MNQQQQPEADRLREEIVAYLDGELTPGEVAAVEQRLARDQHYRNEMLQFQRTWELLGQYPQLTAPTDFTRTTMEMAAVDVEKIEPKPRRSSGVWKWTAACLVIVAAGSAGFMVSNHKAQQPNRMLARDLELLQEFDLFEEVNSIELLEKLDEDGLFIRQKHESHDETANDVKPE